MVLPINDREVPFTNIAKLDFWIDPYRPLGPFESFNPHLVLRHLFAFAIRFQVFLGYCNLQFEFLGLTLEVLNVNGDALILFIIFNSCLRLPVNDIRFRGQILPSVQPLAHQPLCGLLSRKQIEPVMTQKTIVLHPQIRHAVSIYHLTVWGLSPP